MDALSTKNIFCLLALLLVLSPVACKAEERTSNSEYGQRSQQETAGAALFRQNCSHCHGDKGSGGRMTNPLKRRRFVFGGDKDDLMRTIRQGRPQGMPAYDGSLSEEQIEALAAYILWLQ